MPIRRPVVFDCVFRLSGFPTPFALPAGKELLGMVFFLLGLWGILTGPLHTHFHPLQAEEPARPRTFSPTAAMISSPPASKDSENLSEDARRFSADAAKAPLVLLDAAPMGAALQSVVKEKFQFRTSDDKTLSASLDQFVRWGWPREFVRGPVVVLADGSLLVATVPRMAAMMVEVEPDLLEPKGQAVCRLPVGQAAGVVFRLPGEQTERDRLLDRLHRQPPEEDLLLLLNGDELRGRLETIEEKTLRFVGPLGPIAIDISRIRAVQFRRLLPPASGPEGVRIWVGLRDGTLLLAQHLTVQDAQAELTLPAGVSFQTDRDNLVFLQPIGNQVVYLSDLAPKHYQFEPFFEMHWPWERDRSVTGNWLRSGGHRYLKGLGVHSKASLTYDLQGRYSRLEAELALDDASGGQGSAVFRVLADGKEIYQSDPICGGDPPRSIRLDMAKVRQLELVVDYGPRGDQMDRANWLDARLIPATDVAPPASSARPSGSGGL